jgi:hypothetical protein
MPPTPAVTEWLATIDESQRPVVDAVRRLVHNAAPPELREIVYHGALGYGPTESGFDRILYVSVHRDHVTLGFFYGASLPDPDSMLVGSGARMRHVKLRTPRDAGRPVVDLVKAALADGREQRARRHRRA